MFQLFVNDGPLGVEVDVGEEREEGEEVVMLELVQKKWAKTL